MNSYLNKLKEIFAINMLYKNSSLRKKILYDKYIKNLQVHGKNCVIENSMLIKRNIALNLGDNVKIMGGGKFDAQAGIMLGDDVNIEEDVELLTTEKSLDGSIIYDPIIIDRGTTIKNKKKIFPGTIISDRLEGGLLNYNGQIVFIVSTGRSGSKTIANMLNTEQSECLHDAFAHINVWSCDRLYKRRTDKDIIDRLKVLYSSANLYKKSIHGQSDQKLGGIIPFLNKIFPEAKFIWLLRGASSFINSAYPRGWFYNREFGYPENEDEFFIARSRPSKLHAAHRPNGNLLGCFSKNEWRTMTAFERNCWYWTYWNELIERDLKNLPSNKWIQIKLEELSERTEMISNFIGLNCDINKVEVTNQAYYKKISKNDWNSEMNEIYNYHCNRAMIKWYHR